MRIQRLSRLSEATRGIFMRPVGQLRPMTYELSVNLNDTQSKSLHSDASIACLENGMKT